MNQVSWIDELQRTIEKMHAQFVAALGSDVAAKRFERTILTAAQMEPGLQDANRQSLYAACMKAASDGLLVDGREATITTRNKNVGSKQSPRYEVWAHYSPMVQGILKKARNSGEIATLWAEIVREKDTFSYRIEQGVKVLSHEPKPFGDRGNVIGVYAVAKLKSGEIDVETMTIEEVEKARSMSTAKNSTAWRDWWDEMAKKTVLRRFCKRLPMATDLDAMLRADDELHNLDPVQTEPKPDVPSRLQGVVEGAEAAPEQPSQPEQPSPEHAPPPADEAPSQEPPKEEPKYISEPQRRKLWATAKKAGWTAETLKAHLVSQGINSTKEIRAEVFDGFLRALAVPPPKPETQEDEEPPM